MMKNVKKIIALLAAVAMATTGLAGCGSSADSSSEAAPASSEAASSAASEQATSQEASSEAADGELVPGTVKYPVKQLTITCPPAAGGGTDLLIRAMTASMSEYLGVPVIVQNKPGAGMAIGFSAGMKEKPDGSSITAAVAEMLAVPYVSQVDFTYKDFTPICNFNSCYGSLAVAADAPYNTVEEFVAYAKEHPGEIRFSNSGVGGNWHVLAAAFADAAGIEVTHVPFDGGGPAANALAGGNVEACEVSPQELDVHVKSGKVKLLCTFSPERLPELPDLPTGTELGYDTILTIFRGFVGPKDMDPEVVKMIQDATQYALNDPEVTSFMETQHYTKNYMNAEEFYAMLEREDAIYADQAVKLGLTKS